MVTCSVCGLEYDDHDRENWAGDAHAESDCIKQLQFKIAKLQADLEQTLANLTRTQERCTQLLNETRELRSGLTLEGWWCSCEATINCRGIFNGRGKELRSHCRVCGAARPT
jgi:hypothetical protein